MAFSLMGQGGWSITAACLQRRRQVEGRTVDKLHFLAWMDLEVSVELLWFWGCSAGLLGVQPLPVLCCMALVPWFPPNLELGWWRIQQ